MPEAHQGQGETIRLIVGLSSMPVSVKFLTSLDGFENWPVAVGHRFCQTIMRARHGEKVVLTPEAIACPAAAAAFGFKPLPSKLESGGMLQSLSIFPDRHKATLTMRAMRRLELGRYAGLAVAPLELAAHEPDVVVIEDEVEKLMWVALAWVNQCGGRPEFSTGVLQAVCVDCVVQPYLLNRLNLSYGCYGCREATDIASGETVMGFAGVWLETIVNNLHFLADKTIPQCRDKGPYLSLRRRLGGEAAFQEIGDGQA